MCIVYLFAKLLVILFYYNNLYDVKLKKTTEFTPEAHYLLFMLIKLKSSLKQKQQYG